MAYFLFCGVKNVFIINAEINLRIKMIVIVERLRISSREYSNIYKRDLLDYLKDYLNSN